MAPRGKSYLNTHLEDKRNFWPRCSEKVEWSDSFATFQSDVIVGWIFLQLRQSRIPMKNVSLDRTGNSNKGTFLKVPIHYCIQTDSTLATMTAEFKLFPFIIIWVHDPNCLTTLRVWVSSLTTYKPINDFRSDIWNGAAWNLDSQDLSCISAKSRHHFWWRDYVQFVVFLEIRKQIWLKPLWKTTSRIKPSLYTACIQMYK